MKLEWGNVPQWISALCALALAALAIYGLFFSTTSQALVSYLQSELAIRNQRIAGLELREQQLQLSVNTAQSTLRELADKKAVAEKQVAALNAEQETLSQKVRDLGLNLSNAEFSLVREKITAVLASTITPLDIILSDQLDTPEGVRAVVKRPFDEQSAYIKEIAGNLPERDRPLAEKVIASFRQQCSRFSAVVISIPAMRIPKGEDFSQYNWDRSRHPLAIKLQDLVKQVEKARTDIEACFRAVTP
ncbi:MAG: hypothetical protein HXX15_06685 [Rhodopseudomonas sp.]|uniref:hypothetical protein n=1 Tax=Rhodopseudomonas sp. TaxID=1078 RepID=UPI0017E9DEB1|nr:hypothetical protein [Rhodopseudomonas sp.]NVN85760.1 hypothetical protein [Rhodopseudomonas sp.]